MVSITNHRAICEVIIHHGYPRNDLSQHADRFPLVARFSITPEVNNSVGDRTLRVCVCAHDCFFSPSRILVRMVASGSAISSFYRALASTVPRIDDRYIENVSGKNGDPH